jgi:hypothetical protein
LDEGQRARDRNTIRRREEAEGVDPENEAQKAKQKLSRLNGTQP